MARLQYVLRVIALAGAFLALGCAGPTGAGDGNVAEAVPVAPQAGGPAAAQVKGPAAGPAEATASAKEFVSAQRLGDLQVKLRITPFPPVGRNASDLEVTLADASGQAVNDAQVSFDLTMPAMPMPRNQPTAQSAGNGRYTASARMLMRGEWWITVIVRRGGQEQRVTFKGAEVP